MLKDDPKCVVIIEKMVRIMLPVGEDGKEDNNTPLESSGLLYVNH